MTENTQSLMDYIDDLYSTSTSITEEKAKQLSQMLDDTDKLADALPEVKKVFDENNDKVETCDRNIKTWQESKKLWKGRNDAILLILEKTMGSLNIKKFEANGAKLALRKSEKYCVDEAALLASYEQIVQVFRARLPSFVKLSLSIDKTELKNFLKVDNSLLVNQPNLVHSEENFSVNLK